MISLIKFFVTLSDLQFNANEFAEKKEFSDRSGVKKEIDNGTVFEQQIAL